MHRISRIRRRDPDPHLGCLAAAVPAFAVSSADVRSARRRRSRAARDARPPRPQALAAKLKTETDKLDDAGRRARRPRPTRSTPRSRRRRRAPTACEAELQSLRAQIAVKTANIDVDDRPSTSSSSGCSSERVERRYRQGDWYYFDMLLGSRDVRDLIARTELVNRVIQLQQRRRRRSSPRPRTDLERSKAELDRTLQSVNLKKQEAAAAEKQPQEGCRTRGSPRSTPSSRSSTRSPA